MMCTSRNLCSIVSIILIVVSSAKSQEPECFSQRSPTDRTMFDHHCNCLETFFPELDRALTIYVNQTGDCKGKNFHLDWKIIRGMTTLRKIVINGATLTFGVRSESSRNPYVTALTIENSRITYLPAHAFRELEKLKSLRFTDTALNVIQQKSLSDIASLKTLKMVGSSINKIEAEAITNLPVIDNISFLNTNIEDIEPQAIKLTKRKTESTEDCIRGRNIQDVQHMFGRNLNDSETISLPKDGASLFIYKCMIGKVSSKAVSTNVFPYIILGGNTFNTIEPYAFDAHLDNDCEISAFLAIENRFNQIKSDAFSELSGERPDLSRSFIVFSSNIFGEVESKGFQLDPSFQIYNVQQNKFECVCSNFNWFRKSEASLVQNDLEIQLASSKCASGNSSLVDFALSCDYTYLETTTKVTSGAALMVPVISSIVTVLIFSNL